MRGTLPDGAHPSRIAPVAATVIDFEWNTQNTNKAQLLASNYYGTNRSLVVYENVIYKNRPYPQLINVTSYIKMWDATIGAEKLVDFSSYQTLSADKK